MNEIHWANYWEMFKYAKELAKFLPPEHPKRIQLAKELNELLNKLNGTETTEM